VTAENRRKNALDELERASICLNEARALSDAAFPYGAASRAYYAVFHAARALLVSLGLEAKSHKAIVSMIGEHFVRPGRMSSAMGRLVSRMQRDREDADYTTGAVFTTDEAAQMIRDAEMFLAEAKHLIGASEDSPMA
jgi:uncharacterized protein (UPF0332 family)